MKAKVKVFGKLQKDKEIELNKSVGNFYQIAEIKIDNETHRIFVERVKKTLFTSTQKEIIP
jgi:hypothetical protein